MYAGKDKVNYALLFKYTLKKLASFNIGLVIMFNDCIFVRRHSTGKRR